MRTTGKRKRRDWQYKRKPQEEPKHIPPGLQYAMAMAQYQAQEEMAAMKAVAVSKEVGRIQREYSEGVANWYFGLMALALHDEGFGAKRILRVCERINDYHNELDSPDFGPFDLWKVVEEEVASRSIRGQDSSR